MAIKKPICLYAGSLKVLQDGDKTSADSVAEKAISIGLRSESLAYSLDSELTDVDSIANRAVSLAEIAYEVSQFLPIDAYTFNISASTAGSRVGLLVYQTTTPNTVGLARATSSDTMPAFGVIVQDNNVTCKVKTTPSILTDLKVDSSAAVLAGDTVFVSHLEPGKFSHLPPPSIGVYQIVGYAKTSQSNKLFDLDFSPQISIEL